MKFARRTIGGKIDRYTDWRAAVVAEADRVGLPDRARDQVTEPMLRDAWEQHERPDYFVSKLADLFRSPTRTV